MSTSQRPARPVRPRDLLHTMGSALAHFEGEACQGRLSRTKTVCPGVASGVFTVAGGREIPVTVCVLEQAVLDPDALAVARTLGLVGAILETRDRSENRAGRSASFWQAGDAEAHAEKLARWQVYVEHSQGARLIEVWAERALPQESALALASESVRSAYGLSRSMVRLALRLSEAEPPHDRPDRHVRLSPYGGEFLDCLDRRTAGSEASAPARARPSSLAA